MAKPAVILIGADKGGVGKTTVARTLLDYFGANQTPTRAFDTESPRGTLKRFHPDATEVVDVVALDVVPPVEATVVALDDDPPVVDFGFSFTVPCGARPPVNANVVGGADDAPPVVISTELFPPIVVV